MQQSAVAGIMSSMRRRYDPSTEASTAPASPAELLLRAENAALRQRARRWKACAKMLLERSRSLAAMNDRLRRGIFDDRTINEIEQDKRARAEEEERQREAERSRAAFLPGGRRRPPPPW